MNLNATLIGQLIAFALFVWFCMKFVWPPLIKAIETRQANIADALASAENAKQEQADTKVLVEQKLAKAREEAQHIIDLATKRRNEILESVQAEAEKAKIIEQGYAEVENERRRVQEELRQKVAALAVAGAEKIVGRSVDAAANNDIIDKLVAEL
ncbi:F0F1 ATP synthase subunit B [Glaesserella parasuis]|nr:F0F1 ATP synthase subunit B [Glaesserella parasuis]MCT8616240.1 F0F1 ATP synthase subunit B [Glaesserella parasuis]